MPAVPASPIAQVGHAEPVTYGARLDELRWSQVQLALDPLPNGDLPWWVIGAGATEGVEVPLPADSCYAYKPTAMNRVDDAGYGKSCSLSSLSRILFSFLLG